MDKRQLTTNLLLKALNSLEDDDDFTAFKSNLPNHDIEGCKPIPGRYLVHKDQTYTVRELIKNYGDKRAVTVTVNVLRKMNQKTVAEALVKDYKVQVEGQADSPTSSSDPAAAPAAPAPVPAPAPAAAPAPAPAAAPAPAVPVASLRSISADNKSVAIVPIIGNSQGAWNINPSNS